MNYSFSLSPVYNDDSQKVVDLILPIQQIEFQVAVTLQDQPDLLDIDGYYHNKGGGFWAVRSGEDIIATIALINIGHRAGAIRKMFVKKEFRGSEFGLAGQLLDQLIDFCKKNGIDHLYLGTVPVLKAAQRFYEKNNFLPVAVSDLPPYFPRMAADHIFYERDLTQTSGS